MFKFSVEYGEEVYTNEGREGPSTLLAGHHERDGYVGGAQETTGDSMTISYAQREVGVDRRIVHDFPLEFHGPFELHGFINPVHKYVESRQISAEHF